MSFKQTIFRQIQDLALKRYQPSASIPAHRIHCPECSLKIDLPKLRQGLQASCPRCHHVLVQIEHEPYLMPVACALASLLLMAVVYSQKLMAVSMTGMEAEFSLWTMAEHLMQHDWGFLGVVMAVLVFGTPMLFCILVLYVYSALLLRHRSLFLLSACRLMSRLKQWMMVDVFFISILVAYIKVSALAEVDFGIAFWLMPILFLLVLRTSLSVSEHWMYFQIHRLQAISIWSNDEQQQCCTRCLYFNSAKEYACRVCGSELFERRPASLKLSSYFLFAAFILYIPANFLPIMITANPMEEEVSTIMSGIILMWEDEPLIASIIFSASILVPSIKILSLAILLYSVKFRPFLPLSWLSIQYKITEAIGRWSMIDVFVIIILMSTFHTPIAQVLAGEAVVYFCLVVILTMISAHFFDMRLLWDKVNNTQNPAA